MAPIEDPRLSLRMSADGEEDWRTPSEPMDTVDHISPRELILLLSTQPLTARDSVKQQCQTLLIQGTLYLYLYQSTFIVQVKLLSLSITSLIYISSCCVAHATGARIAGILIVPFGLWSDCSRFLDHSFCRYQYTLCIKDPNA